MGNASSFRRLAWSALLLMLGSLAPAPPAAAADRVALVVGIGRYQPLPALPNPPRDAEDMAAMLTRLGYEVDLVMDPDLPALRRATAGFARRLAAGRMGVFYYAGHGVQVGGRNFLVPRGAQINGVEDLPVQGFSLDDALAAVQRTGKPTVVLLDACRDNPFRGLLREAAQPGLAEVNAGSGLLVGFATRPGGVAYDGKERNSPFTAALLRHLPDTRLEARQVLGRVREQVVRATNGRQVPWDQSSLISDLSLAGVMRFQGGLDAAAIPFVSQSVQQNLIRT